MNIKLLAPVAMLLCVSTTTTWAKVSSTEAKKLKNELTQMGAEKAGNLSGTIPAYTGGLAQDKNANPLTNPFADDQPLFTITAQNLEQYKNHLSDGQLALFKKYPNSYKMPIYKTRRSASYPSKLTNKILKNVTNTELVSGGNGLQNFDETIPFAMPKTGLEVIWNHVSRYRGGTIERNIATIPVQASGSFSSVKMNAQLAMPQYVKGGFNPKKDNNILFYYMSSIKSPARLSGNVLLVHETIDQVTQPRMAWVYNAGQRRVRRAPQIAYDAPAQAMDGLRTSDQVDMYNGAPNKYNWELIGKQEMYIPYNAYKLANENAKYKDIIQPGHLNPEFTRYELHRVWKIEATLKEGERHVYGKRTYYIDEDSWQIALADHYDTRNVLWRVAEGHALQFVNANTLWYGGMTNYDMQSGRYIADLTNEEKDPFKFGIKIKRKAFTASALRRAGR
ncbi:MAG: DUF1329 domain-containing protein [Bermanella sp.]